MRVRGDEMRVRKDQMRVREDQMRVRGDQMRVSPEIHHCEPAKTVFLLSIFEVRSNHIA